VTDEEVQLCRDRLAAMAPAVGRIVAKAQSGEVLNCGTGFGLAIDGLKVIATADHVVTGLAGQGKLYFQTADARSIENQGVPLPPIEYPLDPDTAICLGASHGLDAAVIPASDELARRVAWLPADLQIEVAEKIRTELELDPPFLVTLFGFPRFSRFKDEVAKLDVAGAFPLWGYIKEWPSVVATRRELVLEVEIPTGESLAPDAGELGRLIAWRIWQMRTLRTEDDKNKSVLGGYSGGPLFHFDWNGAAVVGLLTDGDLLDWDHRATAVPIDDFIAAVRRTAAWRKLLSERESDPLREAIRR
jgi:hypothetical protein